MLENVVFSRAILARPNTVPRVGGGFNRQVVGATLVVAQGGHKGRPYVRGD